MSSSEAALGAAAPVFPSPARAEASRRNGARSRGPKTPEGKARSAQNALKHGLRAQKHMLLPGENAAAFATLEAALMEELAPEGALQTVLARRVVAAAWRLERAERLEAQLFAENQLAGRSLGLALIRDCNGARSFDTLLRYRGGTLAELWRALRTLKALQAEARACAVAEAEAPPPALLRPAAAAPAPVATCERAVARTEQPDEPERRANPCDPAIQSGRAEQRRAKPDPAPTWPPHWPLPTTAPSVPGATPIKPEMRRKPTESAPPSMANGTVETSLSAASLAGTALVPAGGRATG